MLNKNAVCLLLFCLMNIAVFGQKKIKYDFNSENFISHQKSLKFGETYVLVIENINPFLYNIKDNTSQTIYNVELPSAITSLVLPISLQEIPKGMPRIDVNNAGEKITLTPATDSLFIPDVNSYSIKHLLELDREVDLLLRNCKDTYLDIQNHRDNLLEYFESNADILSISVEILKGNCSSIIERMLKDGTPDEKKLTEAFLKVKGLDKLIDKFRLIHEDNFKYYTIPFKVTSDEIKIDIHITAKAATSCKKRNSFAIQETYKSKNGIKTTFSQGFFLNFGDSRFIGESPFISMTDTVSGKILNENRNLDNILSVGALAHFTWRTTHNVNFGISAGVSTTVNFSTVNLHIGPSIIIGRKSRLILSGGLIYRQSTFLDPSYEYDKEYSLAILPETLPTINKINNGYFFSVTYNWVSPNK